MTNPLPSLDKMTDILDIKPIVQVSLLWFWVILFALLMGLAIGFYYFIKSRKAPIEKPKPEPLLSPREVALRDLDEFDQLGILEKRQYRKYYFRLSEIIRLFLQDEIRLPTVDATTEEIRPHLIHCEWLKDSEKKFMGRVLVEMDLVKFARVVPSPEDVKTLRKDLRYFIETAHLITKEDSDVSS